MPVRVRFAPSPTGYLHVGGARTALFNYLFAKHYGGQFLLRIEDTDTARSTDESTKAIFKGLEWLGLKWDEDVVYQGARAAVHRSYVQSLIANGSAYRCFCTKERLDALRAQHGDGFVYDRHCLSLPDTEKKNMILRGEPYVIRFKVPDEGSTGWTDLVHGHVSFPNKDLGGDFVILRSAHKDEEGRLQPPSPIYNLAVVCDDIDMGITHVLRGDDHVSNTPKQILIYHALGKDIPEFGHMPMIFGKDGKKLSKRHGATAVGDYADKGILPETMLNFLGLLGWNPGHDKEIMSLEDMIGEFTAERMLKKGAVFDTDKLAWMNGQHIQRKSNEELADFIWAHTVEDPEENSALSKEQIVALAALLKPRTKKMDELLVAAGHYMIHTFNPKAVEKYFQDLGLVEIVLRHAYGHVEDQLDWSLEGLAELETIFRNFAETQPALSVKTYFQILRVALVGTDVSPSLTDVLALFGRAETLSRLHYVQMRVVPGEGIAL